LVYVPLPCQDSRADILKVQLRNTLLADDVDLHYIAAKTYGFSGADLGMITQHATQIAIKQAIGAETEFQNERELAEVVGMDDYEVSVLELTKAHFEEAMASARRSVSVAEICRNEIFAQSMKQAGGMSSFRFPTAEEVEGAPGSDPCGCGLAAER
jgi:transitional endoplasmic reticulum ATPase